MQTKIKWFKEVLELEPASKVFFPLARLYFEDGKLEDAVSTLRHGLERNPEHVEARFLLVEILDALGHGDDAAGEVDAITGMLSQYPAFWKVWAKSCAPRAKDSALALSFLAANFQGRSITWSQVMARGLDSFYGVGSSVEGYEDDYAEDDDIDVVAEAERAVLPEAAIVAETLAAEADITAGIVPPQVTPPVEQPETSDDEETEEEATLRTRTMAELLAQQGDYRGALEIYKEIFESLEDADERSDIEACMESLRKRIRRGPSKKDGEAGGPSGDDLNQVELPGKEKLLGTLEALAERLEARATL